MISLGYQLLICFISKKHMSISMWRVISQIGQIFCISNDLEYNKSIHELLVVWLLHKEPSIGIMAEVYLATPCLSKDNTILPNITGVLDFIFIDHHVVSRRVMINGCISSSVQHSHFFFIYPFICITIPLYFRWYFSFIVLNIFQYLTNKII